MDFAGIKEKWLGFVRSMNEKGIPAPMIRDPKSQLGSVSLTLVFISFTMWLISIIGKAAGYLGGINTDQCLNMFMVCAGLYFGRKFQRDSAGKVELDPKESE